MNAITLAECGLLPDSLIRFGIRRLLKKRLQREYAGDPEKRRLGYQKLLDSLRGSPIAIETEAANAQHYEIPAAFYRYALGRHLKYSSCYWDADTENLDQAEARMLALSAQRAQLANRQQILELGCGWGSFTLWMAAHYPGSHITAVSNSHSQREYILEQARQQGLKNIEVITCDVNTLTLDQRFDRIVSIEMFEHMRNYASLLRQCAGWLKDDGKLFVHIFCHRQIAYPFETEGQDNWMGRYFFTGGLMPASDTLLHFQQGLRLQSQWDVSGVHYQKTAEAWLENMDKYRREIRVVFEQAYGAQQAGLWQQRWRMFFMACAELFGFNGGEDWRVAHYLFVNSSRVVTSNQGPCSESECGQKA